jgi:WD40 repeat protein
VVRLWGWKEGKEKSRLQEQGLSDSVLAFTPDGKALATTDGRGSVRLWDAATGKELRGIDLSGAKVRAVAFSPDGSLLAAADADGLLTLWEPKPGGKWRLCRRLNQRLAGMDATPDGKAVAMSSGDGAVTLYDLRTGRAVRELEGWDRAAGVLQTSPDGKLLAGWDRAGGFAWWDLAEGRRLAAPADRPAEVSCAAFSADSQALALGDVIGNVHWFAARTGKDLRQQKADVLGDMVWAMAQEPGGRTLAVSRWCGGLTLYDAANGRGRIELPGKGLRVAVAFSRDGRLLATANDQGRIDLYETVSGQRVGGFENRLIRTLALDFAPDGRTLAVGGGSQVQLQILGYRFSDQPGSTPHFGVYLYDTAGARRLRLLEGHHGQVHAVRFTPDGQTLITGSADHTVLCWDVAAVTGRARKAVKGRFEDEMAPLWTNLAGEDAAAAQRSVAELLEAPEQAVGLLAKNLHPAAEASAEKVRSWIADLDHDEFERREKASRELEQLGDRAERSLEAALGAKPPPETRRRLEQLLGRLAAPSPEWLRSARALQVLEGIGTAEARKVLTQLARGAPEARLTREAKASLRRLEARAALESGR